MPRALRPWATCAGTMGARRACSSRTCWSACASAWPIRRPMAGCGRVGKWGAGWPAGSGLPRSVSNVAGRLCARSSGRSRSRARVIRRRPRPRRNPRLKKLDEVVAEEAARRPDLPVEVFATDEHRLGLKPVLRRVWAPKGQRPIALGHHRYKWLYVTAFTQPLSGETVWYLSSGVSKVFFAALLAAFARETGAGHERSIVLTLDNAGWHTQPNLPVPDGIRLVYLPAYTPELPPAERLWPVLDEPVVNTYFATLADLEDTITRRCTELDNRDLRTGTNFHWWPNTTASQAAMEDGSAVIALNCACAARASMQAPDQRHGEPSSHGGDRVRHVPFGSDRRRRGVGNPRKGEALRNPRRDLGLRGKISPARRSESHKPRCTAWRDGGSRASRGPRSARARLPA